MQQEAVKPKQIAKFCSVCGGHIELQKPEGELEIRHVCQQCGNITYYNPKMVTVRCYQIARPVKCKKQLASFLKLLMFEHSMQCLSAYCKGHACSHVFQQLAILPPTEKSAVHIQDFGLQVVGVICEHEGKILLCRRAIEPCKGLWTLPAGTCCFQLG